MRSRNLLAPRPSLLSSFALLAIVRGVASMEQVYCSNQNTGSGSQEDSDVYQSNGLCYTHCASQYAFAIVQWQNCWCSNYIPAQQEDVSECDQQCPGYPDDLCGSQSKGLYGYIKLPNQPSGTAGASSSQPSSTSSESPSSTSQPSSTSSSSEPPETSYVSRTVVHTITQSASTSVRVSYVTPTPSSSTSSTSSSSTPTTPSTSSTSTLIPATTSSTSTSSSSPSEAPTSHASPVTSIIVITSSGAPVTQTVTSTPWVASSPDANQMPIQRKGLSGGAIAGIVIGVLAALAALLIGAFFLWRRKRQNDDNAATAAAGQKSGTGKSPQRNTSVLSKTGLLTRSGTVKRDMRENNWDEPLYINTGTGNTSRQSAFYAAGAGVSPSSPLDSRSEGSGRRNSKPLVYDQRLNPSALWAHQDANGSRISMQDNHDFSRPLAVTNPDPRASFDSRLSTGGR